MRTIWNGSISFGLVNIPVGMALATKPAARQSDVSFRMLHRECGTPIKNKRWCPQHDREVSNDEIVKGWEVAKGQFVVVEEADLEALSKLLAELAAGHAELLAELAAGHRLIIRIHVVARGHHSTSVGAGAPSTLCAARNRARSRARVSGASDHRPRVRTTTGRSAARSSIA